MDVWKLLESMHWWEKMFFLTRWLSLSSSWVFCPFGFTTMEWRVWFALDSSESWGYLGLRAKIWHFCWWLKWHRKNRCWFNTHRHSNWTSYQCSEHKFEWNYNTYVLPSIGNFLLQISQPPSFFFCLAACLGELFFPCFFRWSLYCMNWTSGEPQRQAQCHLVEDWPKRMPEGINQVKFNIISGETWKQREEIWLVKMTNKKSLDETMGIWYIW